MTQNPTPAPVAPVAPVPSDAARNALIRADQSRRDKRFTGEAPTGFGSL